MSEDDVRRINLERALKNEGVTVILASILGLLGFLGVGHIYIGKKVKGIVLLILGIVISLIGLISFMMVGMGSISIEALLNEYAIVWAISFIIYTVIYIYQIMNARNNAKDFNLYLLETKKNLW